MTMPDGGHVVITLTDVYRQMVELTSRVDSALARQEQVDRVIAEHELELRPLAGAATQLLDHESRLRAIERNRWPLASLTVLLAMASLGVAIAVALTR